MGSNLKNRIGACEYHEISKSYQDIIIDNFDSFLLNAMRIRKQGIKIFAIINNYNFGRRKNLI